MKRRLRFYISVDIWLMVPAGLPLVFIWASYRKADLIKFLLPTVETGSEIKKFSTVFVVIRFQFTKNNDNLGHHKEKWLKKNIESECYIPLHFFGVISRGVLPLRSSNDSQSSIPSKPNRHYFLCWLIKKKLRWSLELSKKFVIKGLQLTKNNFNIMIAGLARGWEQKLGLMTLTF